MLFIIIPIYNVEKYLKECLDSVKNQTFKDFKAIMINDGSTDKSADIAQSYAKNDARFILLNQANMGQAAARNTGLDYIYRNYFLDSTKESVIASEKIERGNPNIESALVNRADSAIASEKIERGNPNLESAIASQRRSNPNPPNQITNNKNGGGCWYHCVESESSAESKNTRLPRDSNESLAMTKDTESNTKSVIASQRRSNPNLESTLANHAKNTVIASERSERGNPTQTQSESNQIQESFIAFLDSDDIIALDYYEKLINAAQKTHCQIAKACDIFIFDDKNYSPNIFKLKPRFYRHIRPIIVQKINRNNVISKVEVWRGIYSVDLMRGVRFDVVRFGEDMSFCAYVNSRVKKIALVKNARYFYRQRATSLMKTGYSDPFVLYKIFKNIYDFYFKNGLLEKFSLPDFLHIRSQSELDFAKKFIKDLEIPNHILAQNPRIKMILECQNIESFLKKSRNFREKFKDNFQLRISKKKNIIKLFGKIIYQNKAL